VILLWLDCETTGLDPRADHILEVAYAIASLERPFEIGTVQEWQTSLPRAGWGALTPFIREMHTKNGLLEDCASSVHGVYNIERALLEIVPEIEDKDERPTLAGASVHFDLGFLRVHMPTIARRLSHRVYDTSAVKLFCRSLGMPKPPREEAHRAGADVLESVVHAKACADWLQYSFRSPSQVPRGLF